MTVAEDRGPGAGPSRATEPDQPGRDASSGWGLGRHLVGLVVAVLAIAALTSSGDSFVTDDGSYELQLRALEQGSWVLPTEAERYDPTYEHQPIAYATPTPDGVVPLAKHPLWPWLAHAISPVTGADHAYEVLGIASVLATALAAWAIAAERERAWRPGALWVAGLAPVAITATIGWAHASAAAAAAVALLGAVRLVQRGPSWTSAALVVVGTALLIGLRSEGLLYAVALGIGLTVGAVRAGRRWPVSGAWGAGVVAVAAAVTELEGRWIRSITGEVTATLYVRTTEDVATSGYLDARLEGAIRSLVDNIAGVARVTMVIALVALLVTSALVAAGRDRWYPLWRVSSIGVLVILVLRVAAHPTSPVTGLLSAWPVAVVGLAAALAVRWRRLDVELIAAALFAGAVLATQYADGGAGQWGGRFYAPATAAVAVAAAGGAAALLARQPAARPYLATALVVPVVLGVLSVRAARSASSDLFTAVEARVEGVAVTPIAQLPRMMWRHDVAFLVVDEDDGGDDLAGLLDDLAGDGGPAQVSLVLREADLDDADAALDADAGWREVGRADANGLTVVRLDR